MQHKQLSDQELNSLLKKNESTTIERTESLKNKDKINEAICAFSNDLAGTEKTGVIFIGIKDDGSPVQIPVTDETLLNLSSIRNNGNILPFPIINVREWTFGLDKHKIIVIEVTPAKNPPVRYKGVCWVRVGPSTQRATEEEEKRLTEKRRASDLPDDMQAVNDSTVESDLNMVYFREQYLPSAISKETLEENHRDKKAQMRSLRLLTSYNIPTMTAILIMGKDLRHWFPGAYIQFVRFNGKNLTDPVTDQKEITGPLPEQIRRVEEVLQAHISTSLELSTTKHIQKPDYPITALSQLIRNAIIHRNYKSHTPIRIHWFLDRIEIQSPGGPYGELNVNNFGTGLTAYRNPSLAEACKNLGFIERFGFGLPQARKALKENGNPDLELKPEQSVILAVTKKTLKTTKKIN